MSIFISIASYCDPMVAFTIGRAIATAKNAQALHFGVVDQSTAKLEIPSHRLRAARLSYLLFDPVYARGPCWARAIAMSFYDGEDWFFQIDSHMDFEANWDEQLIAQAQALLPGRAGLALSAYPNPFVFEGLKAVHKPCTDQVLAHVVKPGASFEPGHSVLGFEAHPVASDQPLPGFHLAAGCLFAPGTFAQLFPYDPCFYFHGEEQALAARLFSHGWDIFHMPGLPIYHLYNNPESGAPQRPLHWDAALDSQRGQSWWSLEQRSRERLTLLLEGRPLAAYGLGRERSMADYAVFSGIDYQARTLLPRAYQPLLPAA